VGAEERRCALHEGFDTFRWLVRSGSHWRMLLRNLPPWTAVYQQTLRWFKAGRPGIHLQNPRASNLTF
jgi:transposase